MKWKHKNFSLTGQEDPYNLVEATPLAKKEFLQFVWHLKEHTTKKMLQFKLTGCKQDSDTTYLSEWLFQDTKDGGYFLKQQWHF